MPLEDYGVEFINPPIALAHPFDDGSAVLLSRSVDLTAESLGEDADTYKKLMTPLVESWQQLAEDLLAPPRIPRHPLKVARFGFYGIRSAKSFAKGLFRNERTRSLFAGLAAHSFLSLDMHATSAFALVMGTLGHASGWPIPRGGAQKISDALASYLRNAGAEIRTNIRVSSIEEVPRAKIILCDITPRQLVEIAGHCFPSKFRKKLERYRNGPGAFKIDWALRGPVPWKSEECTQAVTVHLGGSFDEIFASERACWRDEPSEKPFVILAQPSLFDPTRAPEGQHTLWGYCHVPNSSHFDMTERIENQIERFAPGFREQVLARHVMSPADFERHNPNLIGGDINGGVQDLRQLFTRPTISTYSTPVTGLFICSSSTPPGGGVHGMCGYNAAHTALRRNY